MKRLLVIMILLSTFLPCSILCKNGNINMETVKGVKIEKYLGKWYEIARFPHSFEKGLEGVTATYSIREDGKIKVVNAGFQNSLNGKKKTAIGKAYIPNPKDAAKLKVSFFWIFYGDYYILELDTVDYQWSLVGSSSDKYLWILSRTPKMDEALYRSILEKAKKRNYDISKLIKVQQ